MAIKHGLGRGLSALIKDDDVQPKAAAPQPQAQPPGQLKVPINRISKNPLQPRRVFNEEAIAELAASIKVYGVLQPLLVRRVADGFELISGERRLRASTQAGLTEVPVILVEATDTKSLEIALVENLQRENLNPMEEAEGYRQLANRFNLTQEQIADQVGKARASVANALRLLSLPDEVKRMVSDGQIQAGHAKVIASLEIPEEQLLYARKVATEGMPVRKLEKIVQNLKLAPKKPRATRDDMPKEYVAHLIDVLHKFFGTNVRVSPSKTYANGEKAKGLIEVEFYSNDDLHRILDALGLVEAE